MRKKQAFASYFSADLAGVINFVCIEKWGLNACL